MHKNVTNVTCNDEQNLVHTTDVTKLVRRVSETVETVYDCCARPADCLQLRSSHLSDKPR